MEISRGVGPGNVYPHLFNYEIANFHGNRTFGEIYKRNMYTSAVDILEGLRNNHPINNMFIVQSLTDIITNCDPIDITVQIGKLIHKVNREKSRIISNVNAARTREGAARAEFRVDFEHLASYGMLLSEIFHPVNMMDKVIAISTETIMDLISCYLQMLFDPIIINLAKMNNDLRNRELRYFADIITTVSIFESLLTFTLFCGTTHSYARKLVWATGSSAHPECLKLGVHIRRLNHLFLSSPLWDPESVTVSHGTNEILEDMMEKISGKRKLNLEAIQLMLCIMNDSLSPLDKALSLWMSYYKELPQNDYISPDNERWKLDSLKMDEVEFTANPITLKEAVAKVFNVNNLQSQAWTKPYLRAFKFWGERYKNEDTIKWLIEAGERILHVEVIRYHSGHNVQTYKLIHCSNN